MLKQLVLKNFKCFDEIELRFSTVNVLTGLNGMGKSTVMQSILLLGQSQSSIMSEKVLSLKGKYVNLGVGQDILFEKAEKDALFETPVVKIIVAEKEIDLRNLSKEEHINYYRKELGIRRYIANDKKHKFDRDNPYGKGKIGSRMDLHDEDAQDLLNKAVEIKGRLYAKRSGYYYAFQNEGDIDYHGYRVDDLGDDIKSQLDKEFV